ncbi:uncharacterized protein SPAPADRAFT_63030, partial [Spathaspora passalidarum NRRL Y-27907]
MENESKGSDTLDSSKALPLEKSQLEHLNYYVQLEMLCSIVMLFVHISCDFTSRVPLSLVKRFPPFTLDIGLSSGYLDSLVDLVQSFLKSFPGPLHEAFASLSHSQLKSSLSSYNNNMFTFSGLEFTWFRDGDIDTYYNNYKGPNIVYGITKTFVDQLSASTNYTSDELLGTLYNTYSSSIKDMCFNPTSFNLTGLGDYDICQLHRYNTSGYASHVLLSMFHFSIIIVMAIQTIESMMNIFGKVSIVEIAFIKKVFLGIENTVLISYVYKSIFMQRKVKAFLQENSVGTLTVDPFTFLFVGYFLYQISLQSVLHSEVTRLKLLECWKCPISAKKKAIQRWGLYAFLFLSI